MSPRRTPRRKPRAFRRNALTHALLLACASVSLPAFADEECGAAAPGGQVVCEPAGSDPVPQVRYTGVEDFELVLRPGFAVDGNALPEGDTAVVVYGSGAITLTAEDGSLIQAHDNWPAVDVVSDSGPVNVRVDRVFGGNVGVAALAAGDVTVWANHVTGGTAIEAVSTGGNVHVDVARVDSGAFGSGVLALAEAGDVTVLAGEAVSTGDFGAGIDATSYNGSVSVQAGYVRAEGIGGRAIQAVSYEGGDTWVDVGTAAAIGDGGAAIVAAAGLGDVHVRAGWASTMGAEGVGIGVIAFNGAVTVEVDGLGTDGDLSRGLDISALYDVSVLNGTAFTTGAFADAMSIETVGDVAVRSQRLTTYGDEATGLRVLTGGDIAVDIDEISTYGVRSSALQLSNDAGDIAVRIGSVTTWAETGDWFAIGLSSNTGDVALQVDELVQAGSGTAITMGSMLGNTHVLVAEGARVHGAGTAIDASAGGTGRIDVAGHVSSDFGPVVSFTENYEGDGVADLRIGATGTLEGWLRLGGNADSVANGGEFLSAGTSDFGAGNDRFLNAGLIALRGDADEIRFSGLETLENRGRIDLANGLAGDRFAIDGNLLGAGGVIAIDLDVETGAADRIEVGKLSGTNLLSIDLAGRGPLLGMQGIQVLSSGSAQSGDELQLAADSRNLGFVGFRLEHDGLDSWTLDSDLTDAAYLAGAVPTAVRDAWHQGVQAVTRHLDATQHLADSAGAWLQVVGGDFDGRSDFSHAQGSRELEWQGSQQGLQGGLEGHFGNWRAGVTAGVGKAEMDLGGAEGNEFDGANAGVYARYQRDGWFAGAVLRADRLSLEADWASIGLQDDGDGSVLGLQFEGGRRFAFSRAWVEPSLRLSWTDLSLPELDGASGDVAWQDGSRATGELGLSVGLAEAWKGLRPYATMAIAREFGGADRTAYDTAFDDVVVDAEGGRSYGRFAAGLSWTVGAVDLFGEVEARTGDIEGGTGRIGARVRF